ncbi:MAG: rod shape-determining protein MreC [Oscillospiraceae bacterium]|nr:rod shape-determining protein MreC [Oscillospiraceae bacterium]
MNRLLTKYGMAILSIAVVIAVLLSVMTYFSANSSVFNNIVGTVAAPLRTVGTVISNQVGEWVQYFTDFDDLKKENEQLKQELADLQDSIRQAEHDREENKRLRELLKLSEQRRDLTFESALIIERDISNWSSILTVNKGTMHGVAVGDCAIDSTGNLVGIVTEAGLNYSVIRTILDSESGVGARVFRSGADGVAEGDFALMSSGLLSLSYLNSASDVMSGDLIMTSGLGDYFPSNLVIGYVEELRMNDDGLSRYAVIRPEMDLDTLTQVFIVTDFVIVD